MLTCKKSVISLIVEPRDQFSFRKKTRTKSQSFKKMRISLGGGKRPKERRWGAPFMDFQSKLLEASEISGTKSISRKLMKIYFW